MVGVSKWSSVQLWFLTYTNNQNVTIGLDLKLDQIDKIIIPVHLWSSRVERNLWNDRLRDSDFLDIENLKPTP